MRTTSHTRPSSLLVCFLFPVETTPLWRLADLISGCSRNIFRRMDKCAPETQTDSGTDKKARDDLAKTVGKGKGPLNTGSQGIKKSGKK